MRLELPKGANGEVTGVEVPAKSGLPDMERDYLVRKI